MPRSERPVEETWASLADEERREVYRLNNVEGVAMRAREDLWLRQTREVRAPRPVEAAHEDQLKLEVLP